MSSTPLYIPTMLTPTTLSLAFTPRLTALAAKLNRKPMRRRLPLPTGIEFGGWAVAAILRPQFIRTFGRCL